MTKLFHGKCLIFYLKYNDDDMPTFISILCIVGQCTVKVYCPRCQVATQYCLLIVMTDIGVLVVLSLIFSVDFFFFSSNSLLTLLHRIFMIPHDLR